MDRGELLERIGRLAGVRDPRDTSRERALVATLGELAAELPEVDRRAIAAVIPFDYLPLQPHALTEGSPFERVAQRAALPIGLAREETSAVLHALGEALSDEARARLLRHVARELRPLVSPIEDASPPSDSHAPPAAPARPRSTLATGRPGSDHPLSEARPDVAHRHSLARSDEPHADTKVSSARGTTQERLHETLAEAPPPRPTRTIAGG